jgi:hypothetical protein
MAGATLASAQSPGPASFRVYENGAQVGTIEMTLQRSDEGWRLRGNSRTAGTVPTVIPNLDLHYDAAWNGRFMTMEMKQPDDAIVHVAVVGTTTRTDTVRSTEARFRANSVSPDTIFLPERAYGAYEAIAARLALSPTVSDLPIFVVPTGETRAIVESRSAEQLTVGDRVLPVDHYMLTEIRDRPTPVEIWIDRGRLVRLELPRARISVVRSDVRP